MEYNFVAKQCLSFYFYLSLFICLGALHKLYVPPPPPLPYSSRYFCCRLIMEYPNDILYPIYNNVIVYTWGSVFFFASAGG